MKLNIRKMTKSEQLYCYTQSRQVAAQTGCIGHLRADMDTDGNGFFSSWDDHNGYQKAEEFKDEFDRVINALRFDSENGDVLKNRASLRNYCYAHSDAAIDDTDSSYGFRVDTDDYSYMLRLNPEKGNYNLYCYCYRKDWLDQHLRNAEKGIRFVSVDYKPRFTIPDGEKIKITYPDGTSRQETCRYIDDYHLEVGHLLFHIHEFAEKMSEHGNEVVPLRSSLPWRCYTVIPSTGELIIVQKGEKGYFRTELSQQSPEENRASADTYNREMGITKAQEEAMRSGSMFGWDTPAADPKNYDESGKPIAHKSERGDAR